MRHCRAKKLMARGHGFSVAFSAMALLVTAGLWADFTNSDCGGGGGGRDGHVRPSRKTPSPAAEAEGWIQKAPNLVARLKPAAVPSASEGRPFVFFHVRKGGGSVLRQLIEDGAAARNLTRWIPCHTPELCSPFSLLPNDALRDVYASHVNFADVTKLTTELAMETKKEEFLKSTMQVVRPREDGDKAEAGAGGAVTVHTLPEEGERKSFDCLTNLRSTVSRVVSCWNYRMNQRGQSVGLGHGWHKIPSGNKLSARDWSAMLPVAYDQYMTGCNNEIARLFGDKIDEKEMNTLSPTRATTNDPNPMFLHQFNIIAARMAKCVIIIPERCEESIAVMRHYLPWIDGADQLCGLKMNASNRKETAKELTTNSSDAILAMNQLDKLLVQFGEALFDIQYKIAKNKS